MPFPKKERAILPFSGHALTLDIFFSLLITCTATESAPTTPQVCLSFDSLSYISSGREDKDATIAALQTEVDLRKLILQ